MVTWHKYMDSTTGLVNQESQSHIVTIWCSCSYKIPLSAVICPFSTQPFWSGGAFIKASAECKTRVALSVSQDIYIKRCRDKARKIIKAPAAHTPQYVLRAATLHSTLMEYESTSRTFTSHKASVCKTRAQFRNRLHTHILYFTTVHTNLYHCSTNWHSFHDICCTLHIVAAFCLTVLCILLLLSPGTLLALHH